jgi:hypothetical protein
MARGAGRPLPSAASRLPPELLALLDPEHAGVDGAACGFQERRTSSPSASRRARWRAPAHGRARAGEVRTPGRRPRVPTLSVCCCSCAQFSCRARPQSRRDPPGNLFNVTSNLGSTLRSDQYPTRQAGRIYATNVNGWLECTIAGTAVSGHGDLLVPVPRLWTSAAMPLGPVGWATSAILKRVDGAFTEAGLDQSHDHPILRERVTE